MVRHTSRMNKDRRKGGILRRCLLSVIPALAVIWAIATPAHAQQFSIVPLGDYGNVTVMRFSGVTSWYSANLSDGTSNYAPRAAIAQKFYETHSDEYDFLVIFTNFDFAMPQTGAKAFYSEIRNDIQGIGLTLFDFRPQYGIAGKKLQGLIEMANISGHAMDPLDPLFEQTQMILAHEMMHRWGAQPRFLDENNAESTALLGKDGKHWSFLLDTNGSVLYGNHWQDNGDGTFTSIDPQYHTVSGIGRTLSPLDLYLMGIHDAAAVPPMLLIENSEVDPTQLPQKGVTIAGTPSQVYIDQIIAAMGPRVPAASASQKAFRTAFIYLTLDGTVPAAHLRGIESLRKEWATRFSVLTDGAAVMNADLNPPGTTLPSNPGVTPPVTTPRTLPPSLDEAVSWLRGRQLADGRWEDQTQTSQRDTAVSIQALAPFPAAALNIQTGRQWLNATQSMNMDYLARKIEGLAGSGQDISGLVADLVALRNTDGGWGSRSGYASNPADTALALGALAVAGYSDGTVLAAAVSFLKARQNADGGWSAGTGPSIIQPTAAALSAFNAYRNSYTLEGEIARGLDWLLSKQNLDGGFGNSPSTVYETAAAYMTLRAIGAAAQAADGAFAYLLGKQTASGSWDESVFKTALAAQAVWQGQAVPDLAVSSSDISFTPTLLSSAPASVQISANVRNQGSIAVPQATVALYYGDPSLGNLIGQQITGFFAHAATTVTFTTTVASQGLHEYFIVVDPGNEVREASELNNRAKRTLAVNIPQPTVGFTAAGSSGLEANGAVALTVALSKPWHDPVTVTASIDPASTAAPSADYTGTMGQVTFYPGETTRTINLQVIDDALPEPDETIIVALTGPGNAALGQDRHTYTVIDNEAPSVQILSPLAGPVGSGTPMLQYVSSGGVAVVKVDGGVVNKQSGDLLGPLADGGPYTVRVEVTNAAGMTGFAEVSFTVDTSLPVVTITSPVAGLTNQRTPLLQYTVSLPSSVVVKVDGIVVNKQSGEQLEALADGAHTVRVEATNTLGNTGYASVTLTVDATPPVVSLASPAAEMTSSNKTPELRYTISEQGSGVTREVVHVDGLIVNKASGSTLDPLGDGPHTIRVEAIDAAGNAGISQATFTIESPYQVLRTLPLTASAGANDVAGDAFGNIYAAGYINSGGTERPYIAKYDSSGAAVAPWPIIDTSIVGRLDAIAVDPNGNVYVPVKVSYLKGKYAGKADILVKKYNPSGTLQWTCMVANYAADTWVTDITIDQNGNSYVAGGTTSTVDGATVPSGKDVFVAKCGASGNHLWIKQLGKTSYDVVSALTADIGGSIYVVGATSGDFEGLGRYSGTSAFLLKFTGDGAWQLIDQIDGVLFYVYVQGVATDHAGNVYVTGVTYGALGSEVYSANGDLYLAKYDLLGQQQWVRMIGSTEFDKGMDVGIDPAGRVFVLGYTYGNLDGNVNAGGSDPVVVRYDERGNRIWTLQTDTGGVSRMFIDSNGYVYRTGFTGATNIEKIGPAGQLP